MATRTLPIAMASTAALSYLCPARKVVLVERGAHDITARVMAHTVFDKKEVRVICGDNRFDPYAVSHFARRIGMPADVALRSIRVARAFTAYQFAELVGRLDHGMPGDLVVISGPCSTFFDEDVPFVEAARLFYRMLWQMVGLANQGMTLLLVQGDAPAGTRRAYFLTDLCRAADILLHFGGRHTFTLEHRHRRALPYLAALDGVIGG